MKRKDFSGITAGLEKVLNEPAPATAAGPREAHLRSVQMQIDAISRGDFESVIALAHPDVTLDIFAPPEFPWIRRTRGIEDLRQAVQHNFDAVDNQRPEISNVLAEGDAVVLFGRERGTLRSTGAAYDVEFVHRFTFRDQRLVSVRIIAAYTTSST